MAKKQDFKLVVDDHRFDFGIGIKILKAKYGTLEKCLETIYQRSEGSSKKITTEWAKEEPLSVVEALKIKNLEARRICFKYIGIDSIFKELDPVIVDKQVVKKATKVNAEGKLESFDDSYELYKVKGDKLKEGLDQANSWRTISDFYILRCWCTSTGREYLIYIQDIWRGKNPDAVEAVAWTVQTEVAAEDIDYCVRAGDCIMFKTKKNAWKKVPTRHFSKQEYLEKMKMES